MAPDATFVTRTPVPDVARSDPQPQRAVRVGLLECDNVPTGLRHVGDDYAPMFESVFAAHAPRIAFERIDVIGGEPLPSPGDHDAYLITGSRHSAYDDLPWIAPLGRFVRDLVDAEVGVVGVCFGHQLTAHHLGGEATLSKPIDTPTVTAWLGRFLAPAGSA